MSQSLDEKVISLLEQTEFSRHDLDVLTYHNRAESTRQAAGICFVSRYESPEAARKAEILMDFYIRASKKGTPNYPTEDSLERAFRSARTTAPNIYTERIQDQLIFVISLGLSAGETGTKSLEHILGVVDELLTSPRVRIPGEDTIVMEEARKDVLESIEDRIQNHSKRARFLFLQRYFPRTEPLDEETETEIVEQASIRELVETFDEHLARSFPVLLFSGDSPLETVAQSILPFITSYSGRGDESVLRPPQQQVLSAVGAPVFEHGPSEQMQFLRAYPLAAVPGSDSEKSALNVVNHIFGEGWTCRLMQIIREKHHLVYSIRSSYNEHKNMVLLLTEHNPTQYDRIEGLTREIVEEIVVGNFTDNEFEKARDKLLEKMLWIYYGRTLITCDQPSFRLERAYSQLVEKTKKLSAVDEYTIMAALEPEDARQTAKRFLDSDTSQIFTYSKHGGENEKG